MAYQFGRSSGASASRVVFILVAGVGGLLACGGSDNTTFGSSGGSGGAAGSSGSSGSGGTAASGGSAAGGSSGSSTGGTGAGGSATGGSATGGSATGGSATGGSATGGSATGGSATGGSSTGGSSTGGAATGGTGASSGSGGSATGGSAGSLGGAGGNTGGTAGSGGGGTGGSAGTAGSGSGGTGGVPGCKSNSDCDPKQYCKKSSCAADAAGRCEKRPENCANTQDIVCGCDGVSFWNECLAGHDGVNVRGKGECSGNGTTRSCGTLGGGSCGAGQLCGKIQAQCGVADLGGKCWRLPSQCPSIVVGASYRKCSIGPSAACANLCEAIKDEDPYRLDNSCPQ